MADGPIALIAFGRCDHGDDAAGLVLADAPGTLRRFAAASDELPVSYPHGARGVRLADVVDAVLCGHRRGRRTGARAASG